MGEDIGQRAETMRLKKLYEERILESQKAGDMATMQIYAQLIANLTFINSK